MRLATLVILFAILFSVIACAISGATATAAYAQTLNKSTHTNETNRVATDAFKSNVPQKGGTNDLSETMFEYNKRVHKESQEDIALQKRGLRRGSCKQRGTC